MNVFTSRVQIPFKTLGGGWMGAALLAPTTFFDKLVSISHGLTK